MKAQPGQVVVAGQRWAMNDQQYGKILVEPVSIAINPTGFWGTKEPRDQSGIVLHFDLNGWEYEWSISVGMLNKITEMVNQFQRQLVDEFRPKVKPMDDCPSRGPGLTHAHWSACRGVHPGTGDIHGPNVCCHCGGIYF